MQHIEDLKVTQLREIASSLGITGVRSMRKADLIVNIQEMLREGSEDSYDPSDESVEESDTDDDSVEEFIVAERPTNGRKNKMVIYDTEDEDNEDNVESEESEEEHNSSEEEDIDLADYEEEDEEDDIGQSLVIKRLELIKWANNGNFALAHIGDRVNTNVKTILREYMFNYSDQPFVLNLKEISSKQGKCGVCGEKRRITAKGTLYYDGSESVKFVMGPECEKRLSILYELRLALDKLNEMSPNNQLALKIQVKKIDTIFSEFSYTNEAVHNRYNRR